MKQLLILILFFFTLTTAQPPAAAPAPPGPTNLTAVLEKAGRFTIFIRLLQSTKVADQIYTQLNNSNQGLTVFTPTDSAFSNLKSGTLNSYTDEQKTELIQFHVLPSLYTPSQFQTASNPLRTQAGGSEELFPLNVTAVGNGVNITTGETNATVANTVYSDDQLAVYEVDQVLLPRRFFVALPPPPPPPVKPKKAAHLPEDSSAVDSSSSSTVDCMYKQVFRALGCVMLVLAAFP